MSGRSGFKDIHSPYPLRCEENEETDLQPTVLLKRDLFHSQQNVEEQRTFG